MDKKLLSRITFDVNQCGGKPCIRGMRIRVADVLSLLANGLTAEQVIQEMPDLTPEDIQASLQYAASTEKLTLNEYQQKQSKVAL
ncbi:MAG: DUF433 domain-containing protein [Chitinophagales bacterium]